MTDSSRGYFDGYNGNPHESGHSAEYDNGYAAGYAAAEQESAMQVTTP